MNTYANKDVLQGLFYSLSGYSPRLVYVVKNLAAVMSFDLYVGDINEPLTRLEIGDDQMAHPREDTTVVVTTQWYIVLNASAQSAVDVIHVGSAGVALDLDDFDIMHSAAGPIVQPHSTTQYPPKLPAALPPAAKEPWYAAVIRFFLPNYR